MEKEAPIEENSTVQGQEHTHNKKPVILDLPNEIILQILSNLNPVCSLVFALSYKRFYSLYQATNPARLTPRAAYMIPAPSNEGILGIPRRKRLFTLLKEWMAPDRCYSHVAERFVPVGVYQDRLARERKKEHNFDYREDHSENLFGWNYFPSDADLET